MSHPAPNSCFVGFGLQKHNGERRQSQAHRVGTIVAGSWIRFHATEIAERSYKLDITWLKDESLESSDDLPDPQDLATESITELESFVGDLREIVALIEQEEGVEI